MVNILYAVLAFTCAMVSLILPVKVGKELKETNNIIKSFSVLISWTALFCGADGLWGLFASDFVMNSSVLFAVSLLFFAISAITPVFWLGFVITYLGATKFIKLFKWGAIGLVVIQLVLVVLNGYYPFIFDISPEGIYGAGNYRAVFFFMQYGIFAAIAIISFTKFYKERLAARKTGESVTRHDYSSVLAFVAAPLAAGIIQMVFPEIPAYSIGYTLGGCIIYVFIMTDLLQERLLENTRAEAANEAKTSFLFTMSHDIRTPMNAIMGFTNVARKNIDDKERVSDCLDKIETSGKHLLDLINAVLDMSRLEAGKIYSEKGLACIRKEGKKLVTVYKDAAESQGVGFYYYEIDIVHETVRADVLSINRILTNIIGNAIKYTKAGGRVIFSVRESECDKAGYGTYEFTVDDTGIGMTAEFLKIIFDAFSREESEATREIQGTGMGMAIVKRLVDLLGGTIEIESEKGRGTSITVRLDMEIADKEEICDPEEVLQITDLKGRRILLVEDNDFNREIAAEILGEQGIIVDEAVNGLDAINAVAEKGTDFYDCILMDIQMPVMNGYEATAEIRRMPGADKLIIIALSANAFEDDRHRSAEAGMNDHISKPIEPDKLTETLIRYL